MTTWREGSHVLVKTSGTALAWIAMLAACFVPATGITALADTGCGESASFTVDNRAGGGSCGESASFTIDNRAGSGNLSGLVVGRNAQGQSLGALAGATVSVSGVGDAATDSDGEFAFGSVPEGTYSVTVSKSGYYATSRSVTIHSGESRYENFSLTAESNAAAPVLSSFSSPNGRHFVEGMPGNLTFVTDVAWNGSPGSVRFKVADEWYAATQVQDLGGGAVRATLTVPSPSAVAATSELEIQATNGESVRATARPGVYFYPLPSLVDDWYQYNLSWAASGSRLGSSREIELTLWSLSIPSGLLTTEGVYADSSHLWFDSHTGTLTGERGVEGGVDWKLEYQGVEQLSAIHITGDGTLAYGLRGFSSPTVEGSLGIGITGKVGAGAPLIFVVDAVFPPLSLAMSTLRAIPVVGDVLTIAKLRIFLIGGLGVEGHWMSSSDSCWLGASSWDLNGTMGVEGQALLAQWGAEVGVYAGGTGTPAVQACPEWQFQGITLHGYVGAFAKYKLFKYSTEVGWEMTLGESDQFSQIEVYPQATPMTGRWERIGDELLKWGEANQLVASSPPRRVTLRSLQGSSGTEEQLIASNVTSLATPKAFADPITTRVVFVAQDPAKPWYASTDIGQISETNTDPWALELITDDEAAEFSPVIAEVNADTLVAAWERVDGDVSQATGPEDVAPHLEIVSSRFDRASEEWTPPTQLTSNAVVDRDPRPVVFGGNEGVLWIQNQADASLGDATNGDRLMFAAWNGSGYSPPQTLWSDQKGVLTFSFAADASGQGHIVLAVDEDGDLETRDDRELYGLSTVGGAWQPATRLTTDSAEDAVPVLIAVEGTPICVWSAGGTVSYTDLAAWNPKPVYSEQGDANEAATLDGVEMPGGAAIAYTVQGPSGIDLVASFYDAVLDKWSQPRQLTQDEHAETSVSLAYDGTDLIATYLKTQTERNTVDVDIDGTIYQLDNIPQPARTDLYVLRHALGDDLAVAAESLAVEPGNPTPGSAAVVHVTVENRGDLAVQNAEVAFYDGDPNSGGVQIGEVQVIPDLLVGGARREVSIPWSVPLTGSSGTVFAIVDPSVVLEDRDRSNNTASVATMLPDLTIETGSYDEVSDHSLALTARVVNVGALPCEEAELSWRLGSADGPVVGTRAVGLLAAGSATEEVLMWDTTGRTPGEYVDLFAVVDANCALAEWDDSNNALAFSARVSEVPEFSPVDFDRDGHVDAYDHMVLAGCLAGPDNTIDPNGLCPAADFDADADVDLSDFAVFQVKFTGDQ